MMKKLLFCILPLLLACGGGNDDAIVSVPDLPTPPPTPAVIAVESVTLSHTEVALKVGETVTLTASVLPEDATSKTVTWSTSDRYVASVSNGEVTAVGVGTATITAKAGGKNALCKIIVSTNVIAVESITLSQTEVSLKVGETVMLTACVLPEDATSKTVAWGTSDRNVAKVSNGEVTAIGIGTATITATAGSEIAKCTVTVCQEGGGMGADIQGWDSGGEYEGTVQ